MNSLEPPDLMHLHGAEGWLGLGNWEEANDEWEKIAPTLRSHPDVLEVPLKRWRMAASEDPDLEPLWDYMEEAGI